MILSTTDTIPQTEIIESIGIITGNSVISKQILQDILGRVKTLLGGEIPYFAKLLNKARNDAMHRLELAAEQSGADAVINVRLTTHTIMDTSAEVLAYGTAVKTEPTKN